MGKIKPLYDGIKLNCTIVSDTHIDIKHPMPWLPKWRLKTALKEAQNSLYPVDSFIIIGDTTSRGSQVNWEMTVDCFRNFRPAEKILLAIGNHDGWNDNGFDEAYKNYIKYSEIICGVKRTKPYFTEIINGYHLIFLGNDSESGCEAEISDEQLEWFSEEMNKASQSGKPIFVFCHQSLNQKHGLPITWDKDENPDGPMDGGLGKQSDAVEEILKKYRNVYYFSGHSHMGLGGERCKKEHGYASIEQEDSLTLINLPSLACGNHHGEDKAFCMGFQLEVYDGKVIIRPRNLKKHSWNRKIAMKNGKPYWENQI